jgi:hypothetical protein
LAAAIVVCPAAVRLVAALATEPDLVPIPDSTDVRDFAVAPTVRADGVRSGVLGFGTAGRVVVVVRAVVPVERAPVALVGAFLAAAIRVFLLANDCGLVSAWRP